MSSTHQMFGQAVEHFNAGRLGPAEALLRQILQANPAHGEALNLLGVMALNSGHAPQAVEIFSRAVQVNGSDAESHCNLGVALLSLGKGDDGERALRAALKLKPGHPMANFNIGLRDLQSGRFDDARQHLDKAVKKMPKNLAALNALGVAHSKCAKPAKAAQLFRTVLKAAPDHLDAKINLAGALTDQGQLDDAIALYEQLIAAQPGGARLHFNLGVALRRAHRESEAIAAYLRALELDENLTDAHVNLATAYVSRGDYETALTHINIARDQAPMNPDIHADKARVLRDSGQGAAALAECAQILDQHPDHAEALSILIQALQNDGDFEEARAQGAAALERNPDGVAVLLALSRDKGFAFSAAQLKTLEAAAKVSPDPAAVWFALANIHHNRGDGEAAFKGYRKANALRDAKSRWTADDEQALFDGIIGAYSKDLLAASVSGSDSTRPLFILGLPRSGTTLVEQIVASHGAVAGGGELTELKLIADALTTAKLDAAQAEALAQRYLERLDQVSPDARYVTDKMPDNYLRLGLIQQLFPNARIIHCRRAPMATGFSIYQQNFRADHPYAYDLGKLGRRLRNHDRLMAHWKDVLSLDMLDVAYEDLVGDVEGQSRRILDFCGLDWDAAVLDFHKAERTVQTASLWQVRQPIYTTAVEGWRVYEGHLGAMREALEA